MTQRTAGLCVALVGRPPSQLRATDIRLPQPRLHTLLPSDKEEEGGEESSAVITV